MTLICKYSSFKNRVLIWNMLGISCLAQSNNNAGKFLPIYCITVTQSFLIIWGSLGPNWNMKALTQFLNKKKKKLK